MKKDELAKMIAKHYIDMSEHPGMQALEDDVWFVSNGTLPMDEQKRIAKEIDRLIRGAA